MCFTPDFFKFQYQASFKIWCFVVRQSLCVCYSKVLIWYAYLNYLQFFSSCVFKLITNAGWNDWKIQTDSGSFSSLFFKCLKKKKCILSLSCFLFIMCLWTVCLPVVFTNWTAHCLVRNKKEEKRSVFVYVVICLPMLCLWWGPTVLHNQITITHCHIVWCSFVGVCFFLLYHGHLFFPVNA